MCFTLIFCPFAIIPLQSFGSAYNGPQVVPFSSSLRCEGLEKCGAEVITSNETRLMARNTKSKALVYGTNRVLFNWVMQCGFYG